MRIVFIALILIAINGCAIVGGYNMPPSVENSDKKVEAQEFYFNPLFLAPAFKTSALVEQLKNQCAGKKVTGITLEVKKRIWSFIGAGVTLNATGYCSD